MPLFWGQAWQDGTVNEAISRSAGPEENRSVPGETPDRSPAQGDCSAATPIRWLPAVGACVATLSLFAPLASAGLWAPYELTIANLSRRIAVGLHGAEGLGLNGAPVSVPTLGELGRGQLPFSSVALGFQALGLDDWTGRVPLALWAAVGVLALYRLVRHFVDATAAAYATVVLSTTPLYFLQARTLLGDAVILASVSIAVAGLTRSTFGNDSRGKRSLWAAIGLGGLVCGFVSRGILFGVACPAFGVGLAWAATRGESRVQFVARRGWALGWLTIGALSLGLGAWGIVGAPAPIALELLGSKVTTSAKLPTHDSLLHQLGHGLFPWSAVAPFLLVPLFAARGTTPPGAPRDNSSSERPGKPLTGEGGRTVLAVFVGVFLTTLAAQTLARPYLPPMPFVALACIAGWIGVGFRSLSQHVLSTRLIFFGSAALLVILGKDLLDDPGSAMNAFGLGPQKSPEGFLHTSRQLLKPGLGIALVTLALFLGQFEEPTASSAKRLPSQPSRRIALLSGGHLGQVWHRRRVPPLRKYYQLAVGFTVLALPVAAAVLVDQHLIPLDTVRRIGPLRPVARFGFLLFPVLALLYALLTTARSLLLEGLRRLPWPRAHLCWAGLSAVALLLSLAYYPALAKLLSPRGVFSEFAQRSSPGEALAIVGNAKTVAPFYTSQPVVTPGNSSEAFSWLTADTSPQRRWLIAAQEDIAPLNSLFRKSAKPAQNLPIVFSQAGDVSLATSRLHPDEVNLNPLEAWVQSAPPEVQFPLDVQLKDQLQCLGWSLRTVGGDPVTRARTGQQYELQVYWKVLAPIRRSWKAFIHIDGGGRRFNGDHDLLQGQYPMRFWRVGDYITDTHPVTFAPQYARADYEVYFGLFSGNSRLPVTRGDHHEDRIRGGQLSIQ